MVKVANETVGVFGVTSLVFFRRNVETGEPLFSDPQVWTYNVGDRGKALCDLEELKQSEDLFVCGLSGSTHRS